MTRNLARIAVASLVLCTGAFAQTGTPAAANPAAPAATAPATAKIGIVDIQTTVLGCNEGRRDFEAAEKKFEPRAKELQGLQQEIENLNKQLNTQGDKLNDEAKGSLQKQISQKTTQYQRMGQDLQSEAQQQQQEIFQRIYPKVMKSLDEYAKGNGFTLVLDYGVLQQGVTWANPAIDITEEVMNRYNQVSGVPAPAPRPAAGAAAGGAKTPGTPAAQRPATPGATKPAPKQ